MTASVMLAGLAVVLAWPVPLVLSRAGWTRRSPAVALGLWQAIAIAGGLSMVGALLTFGLQPFGDDLVSGGFGFIGALSGNQPLRPIELWNVFALCGATLLAAHLLLSLLLTVVRTERQRRRHQQLLLLLSSPMPSGSRLIDTPAPVAYCLPSAVGSVTVVSAGLVALLDEPGMRAVIEHEKAHVRQRHDIVLVLFRAWYAALPWFPIAYRAQREVTLLVELLADDQARRAVDDAALAGAIVRVAAGRESSGDTAELPGRGANDTLSVRLARLDSQTPQLARGPQVLVGVSAIALLAVPTVLLAIPAAFAFFG